MLDTVGVNEVVYALDQHNSTISRVVLYNTFSPDFEPVSLSDREQLTKDY